MFEDGMNPGVRGGHANSWRAHVWSAGNCMDVRRTFVLHAVEGVE